MACSDTEIALAPPLLADRHLGAPRGLQIDVVVAGAEQLDQLQLGRRLMKRVRHLQARIADYVFRRGHRRLGFGLAFHDHGVEARRRHLAGNLADLGKRRRYDDNPRWHIASWRFLNSSDSNNSRP